MKLKLLTIVGMAIGLGIIIISSLRYFVTYTDWSQGVLFILQGVWIVAFSWVYEVLKHTEARIEAIEIYLVDKEVKRK